MPRRRQPVPCDRTRTDLIGLGVAIVVALTTGFPIALAVNWLCHYPPLEELRPLKHRTEAR